MVSSRGAALALATAAIFGTVSARLAPRQTSAPSVDAISSCSVSQSTQFCQAGSTEFRVVATPTSGDLPSSYSDCHPHATDLYCFYSDGEVQIVLADATITSAGTATSTPHEQHGDDDEATAVSECHLHGSDVYCMWGSTEYSMDVEATATQDFAPEYTNCHAHGSDTYCVGPDGEEVRAVSEASENDSEPDGEHCHFHAGVEHCVGPGESETGGTRSCERTDREYNVPLRIGLVFVILVTSAMGVFGPIFLMRFLPEKGRLVFVVVKQFGTGVIIATAFVHLYTHAQLMFSNPCLEGLQYEGTTSAIVMAGIFLSFLVEYIGQRIVKKKMASGPTTSAWFRPETVSIMVLEAGIVFHSILIGITLVVAGDSFFITLFIVILFHQIFEGLALGSRIAALGTHPIGDPSGQLHHGHGHGHGHCDTPSQTKGMREEHSGDTPESSGDSAPNSLKTPGFSLAKKCVLASAFALITPLGMAIGIGVLGQFNGNDQGTIIAIGTLDAVSAGILVWVGVVEMWAEDWMYPSSELMNAGPLVTTLAMFGLIAGMALMSFLGKWA